MKNFLLMLLVMLMAAQAKSKLSDKDLDYLATTSGYIEGLMRIGDSPVILDDWQREKIDDESSLQVDNKSRQIGESFGPIAAKALAKSQLYKRKLSVFTSMNLDDAREKIIYARELYDSIPNRFKSKLTTDNKFELGFANGSRIVTMFVPRGKGPGDVYIDEMGFMRRAKDIYNGALYMTSRAGNISIASTPFGKNSLYYQILTDTKEYPDYKRRTLPWWVSSALCIDVRRAMIEAPGMLTHERVEKFGSANLKRLFRNTTLESFMQEMECVFMEEQTAFLPYDLIKECVDESEDYLYFNRFTNLAEFVEDLKRLKNSLKGIPYGGYDVGRKHHPAVLALTEEVHKHHFTRICIPLKDMRFPDQKEIIRKTIEILPIPKFCIDSTGLGMDMAEELSTSYPGIVIPVNFASTVDADMKELTNRQIKVEHRKKSTLAVKERMATDIKIAMQSHNLTIPPDKDLMLQFNSVKAETSIAGHVTYAVDKNESHHADKFWAIGLCLFGARRPVKPITRLATFA